MASFTSQKSGEVLPRKVSPIPQEWNRGYQDLEMLLLLQGTRSQEPEKA